MEDKLWQEFSSPSDEFTPIPFWFWNDALSESEISRQIHDFKEKGVMGFVIHPRLGLPEEVPYLSDSFMHYVKFAVEEAAGLGMKVVLYDEGMYPSGSAHGMVVRGNPEYASHALRLEEIPCAGGTHFVPEMGGKEKVVSAVAVEKTPFGTVNPESVLELECKNSGVDFEKPGSGDWSVLFFIETYSGGTIRGIHFGEDDGEPGAPLSGDLLNPDAMEKFIKLTYERYYSVLKEHFGSTVIAMFTDEPDMLGRGSFQHMQPWTPGFLDWYAQLGGSVLELPFLWFDGGEAGDRTRKKYRSAVLKRLEYAYYSKISDWCRAHGIALTGHPGGSDEIGLLKHFQIPGQDIVWRFVSPEEGKSISGPHSTMGKCSSDSARHLGRRRNSNECFGCCGPNGMHWAFSADDMKWYMDWLFVRGVNLLYPHAFYYSLRGKRAEERPPDVGPNNLWWPYYKLFADYVKRMSWLMTDCVNGAAVAVLCEEDHLAWRIVKSLYENQIEFNYLEKSLLLSDACRIADGQVFIEAQKYRILLVEDISILFAEDTWAVPTALYGKLNSFTASGGILLAYNPEGRDLPIQGAHTLECLDKAAETVKGVMPFELSFSPSCSDLRISYVLKKDKHFYLLVNEGELAVSGELSLPREGRVEIWNAWKGTRCVPAVRQCGKGLLSIPIAMQRRESLIVYVDSSRKPEISVSGSSRSAGAPPEAGTPMTAESPLTASESKKIPVEHWIISNNFYRYSGQKELNSWTKWKDMEHFSGTVTYESDFSLDTPVSGRVFLALGEVHEMVHLFVNEQDAGIKMWAPYEFEITRFVVQGSNRIKARVTNSIANRMLGAKLVSGLIGPVCVSVVE